MLLTLFKQHMKVFVKDHIVINRYSLNNAILQYHDIVVSEETFNWIGNYSGRYAVLIL